MSLLWLLAVIVILMLLQWPSALQWLTLIGWSIMLLRNDRRPSFSLDTSKDVLHWQQQGASGVVALFYQTEWWSVVILHPDPQQPLFNRLLHHLSRYRWLYRDQLPETDYRYLRSRLNVEKLLGLPTQKSESAASK